MAADDPIMNPVLDALRTQRGIVFGDVHGDISNPEWVRDHLSQFRAAGVTTFYTEMLNTDEQPMIDGFMKGDPLATLQLRQLVENRWGGRNGGQGVAGAYFSMFEAARTNGMRIVGIDNDQLQSQTNRLGIANPAWAATIEKDRSANPDGKFLVYVGADHTASRAYYKTPQMGNGISGDAIPIGVDRMLGVPSFDFNNYRMRRDQVMPAPSNESLAPGGDESTFEISLPRSQNQREAGATAAPQYALPANIQSQIAALKGMDYKPVSVENHGAPAVVPSSAGIIRSEGR